jgi:hypothetical protein
VAGRAHQTLGYVYANGSNENCGLYNTYYTCNLCHIGASAWYTKDTCH